MCKEQEFDFEPLHDHVDIDEEGKFVEEPINYPLDEDLKALEEFVKNTEEAQSEMLNSPNGIF